MAPYTEEDLKELTDAYETVNTWLEAKLAEQEKLKPHEDPVFAAGELQKKATELNDALMKVFNRKMKPLKSSTTKSKAPKPTKKPKAKTAKGEDKVKSVKDKISEGIKSATEKVAEDAKVAFEIKDEGEKPKAQTTKTRDEL
jgi:hypoxia up-regulated 1